MLESAPPEPGAASTCESCGESFTCGAASSGCWCREVQVSAETREGLRQEYSACLCRSCLERAAAGRDPAGTRP